MMSRQLVCGISRCNLLSGVSISCNGYNRNMRVLQLAYPASCFCSTSSVTNVIEDSNTNANLKVPERNTHQNRKFQNTSFRKLPSRKDFYGAQSDPDSLKNRKFQDTSFRKVPSHKDFNVAQSEPDSFKNRKFQNTSFRKIPSRKDFYVAQSDPDSFGNLQGSRELDLEIKDEGDEEEEKFLEEPPARSQKLSTKQYATMIKEFFSNKQVGDAIDVLETRMLKMDRVKPENYIYNLIIGECGRLGYTKKAFQLYNQMKKRDLKVTGATYTGLFNACANSPWPQDGLKRAKHLRELIIEKGHELNASNYHAMIKAFGRCGDLSTAFSLVDEMADKQLPIAENTFNFLFHACITDNEAGFRHALLVWRKMKDNRVKPDIYTFNLLLRSIRDCGLGDLDSAHNVIHQILQDSENRINARRKKAKPALEAGDKPPIISLESLEKEVSTEQNSSAEETETKETKPSQLTNLAVQITDNRPNLLAYKPQLGNIIGLTEITKPEDRLLLVGGCSGFLEQMKRDRVEPNIKTFTQLLDNIPSTKSAETALLSAMNKEGVVADIDFYNMLIKKRSMRSDYVGAREVLSLIRRAKVHPDIITFGVLALACRTQEEAESFLSDMKNAGFRPNAEILGAMLKTGCITLNFDYVLSIMELTKEERIKPNAEFLQHLENFIEKCEQRRKFKNVTIPGKSNEESNHYFKNGFKKFMSRHRLWLQEVVYEKAGHPWEQFQKKTQTTNQDDMSKFKTRN